MGYFKKLGKTKINNNIVCNLYDTVIEFDSDMIYDYIIENAESPEQLSIRLYGKSEYYWILLELNNCIDPILDWVMSDEELILDANKIYGDKLHDIHHYEDENNNITYDARIYDDNIVSVSNFKYMVRKNEEKIHIKIISKSLLNELK